jgi:hypothetical protein
MADTRETNRSVVTPSEAVGELFGRLPQTGKDIVWLADELISVVQHIGSISLEIVRDGTDSSSLVCSSDSTESPVIVGGRGPPYLFRPLLARLAVLGSEETGTEFQTYGGRYSLTRSSRSVPVRLDIEYTNTTTTQRLTISRTLVLLAHPLSVPSSVGTYDSLQQHTDS